MYLNSIIIENNGPISRLEILEKDLFKENGDPKVLILAGKNGSGKTILLSNIVDSIFELQNQIFNDVLPEHGFGGHKYYRTVGNSNQKIGTQYSFSFINYKTKYSKNYQYLEKTGLNSEGRDIDFNFIKKNTNDLLTINSNWDNPKIISDVKNDKDIKKDFIDNTYCFFPVSRFESPHWLNDWKKENREQIGSKQKFDGVLGKPLIIESGLDDNKSWILDVFLDFLTDFEKTETGYNAPEITIKEKLKRGKENLELILRKILQNENLEIKLNLRNNGVSRLKLIEKQIIDGASKEKDLLPSLDNLSGGQSILLNIFASIIKLSDKGDINKSINISNIEGIVLIDEIDLSLHIDLQKDVLPELLSLFPKIQFIISSHSPFFLLGLEEKNKKDSNFLYQVIRMPDGLINNDIKGIEEVSKAYNLFEENFKDFKKEFDELNGKIITKSQPIIFTEGKTDWKYYLSALKYFHNKDEFKNIKEEYFLKYGDKKDLDDSSCGTEIELNMGDSELNNFLNNLIHTRQKDSSLEKNIRIGLFDSDNKTIKVINDENNKVYGITIIPENISIEFLFTEDEIKTEIQESGINKRLFIGTEFDDKTKKLNNNPIINLGGDNSTMNKCGKKIIIDKNVFNENGDIALSKDEFSKKIYNNEITISDSSWENFRNIFEKIVKIFEDNSIS